MRRFLLRVEGVNLGEVLEDTNQLSVRRGGGLLLLNTPPHLLREGRNRWNLQDVVVGASIGLFEFEAESLDAARAVRDEVAESLATGSLRDQPVSIPLRHATFVVDVVPLTERPAEAVQQALAANRWRQLQSPTVPLAGLWPTPPASEPCALDRTRPGVKLESLPGESQRQPVSTSAWDRFVYGREARRGFYQIETGQPHATTDNLQDLASLKVDSTPAPPHLAHLDRKLAVLYLDGNRFGGLAERAVESTEGLASLRHWSQGVRHHHRTLLTDLLAELRQDPDALHGDDLRLETLLWGGDEILWVLPAWKGWEVVRWFFSQSHRLDNDELTYSGGLVFAHANAPIQGLTRLAKNLGGVANQVAVQPGCAHQHALAYEVLESYDDVSVDLDRHRRRFVPEGGDPRQLVLDPSRLEPIWEGLRTLAGAAEWPRRQLYRLVAEWRRGADFLETQQRLEKSLRELGVEWEPLEKVLGPAAWQHLLMMLPYVPGPASTTGEGL